MLLTGLALAGTGVAAYVVESDRIERRISAALAQEIDEFNTFREQGIDPRTGTEFTTVQRLFETALRRNVPDDSEVLIGWWDGQARQASNQDLARQLANGPVFDATVRPLVSGNGGVQEVETVLGATNIAVQPVADGRTRGAWVVVFLEDAERADLREVMQIYALVALLALGAVSAGAWSVSGRLLRPVRELTATTQEISETDLSRRIPVDGRDDVSDLVRTVNAMLSRLEEAFDVQRTFVDDAGHELRTPVTVLRGHLEVLDESDAADVASTRTLLLDEIDRMSRLVDDLLVLAKAGRPDFVQPEPVDAGVLTDQVLDKVSATAGRDWHLDARASGTVVADPQRITQALLQLVSNALRHTRPGDVVAVGSERTFDAVRWWVRDTGPGVPAHEQGEIFERFRRGRHGVASGEGSGLGLSIVRAIARAHGGRVDLQSVEGGGATFLLSIPVDPQQRQPVALGSAHEPYDDHDRTRTLTLPAGRQGGTP